MEILLRIFSILVSVFLLALLIFGLIQCKKNHFIEGFYFFLIVIFLKIYYVIAPFTINRFIDSYIVNPTLLPLKMTIGEMITLLNFIPRTLEVIAFFFLVVGLYRMWKTKD